MAAQFDDKAIDYHYYRVKVEICEIKEPSCTRRKVFDELGSNDTFTRIIASDLQQLGGRVFDNAINEVLPDINKILTSRDFQRFNTFLNRINPFDNGVNPFPKHPIHPLSPKRQTNQKKAIEYSSKREVLSQTPSYTGKLIGLPASSNDFLYMISELAVNKSKTRDLVFRNFLSQKNNNPIRQERNNEAFKITNYTLPGHILHKGQVEIQIVEEGSKIIFVVEGRGNSEFSKLGPNPMFWTTNVLTGIIVSKVINKYGGEELFRTVGLRFKNHFDSLPH